MPDILNPALDLPSTDLPDIDTQIDFPKWDSPSIKIPELLQQSQDLFSQYPGSEIDVNDFSSIINSQVTDPGLKQKTERQKLMDSLVPDIDLPVSKNINFRYFSSADALRYKQNDRLWKKIGYNPELPPDVLDAMYDHAETKWESIKNVFPKLWETASFQFKNYFAEYADTAEAIGKLDWGVLQDQKRFLEQAEHMKRLEEIYPDYKTDRETKWWQILRGDFWEESGSSLGFTLGTIGAALLENIVITAATAGIGEIGSLYNTPRKIFKAIGDYYSLRRAYGLIKGAVGAKSVLGKLGAGVNIWRLTNGALSEAAYEGFNAKHEYEEAFKQDYLEKYGKPPDEETMRKVREAGEKIASATTLFQTPFLMASNAAQFGNIIAPKTISRLLTSAGLKKPAFNLIVDPAFRVAVEANPAAKKGLLRGAVRGIRGSVWEGTEESYQALVSKSTADYYNDEIFNKDDKSLIKSLGAGFKYVTSNTGMKEFTAGFATGAIFQHIGKPFHYFARPKSIINPTTGDKEFQLNIFNKAGIGMKSAAKEMERQQFEKIAKRLNASDLEKVLKEEGFMNLVKDKRTQLALAKYVQNNDLFNMQNTQNLQLNRMLYSGLVTGKIDLQISKLKQFAQQDFKTLQDFFDLDENDYQTPDQKNMFLNNFRNFAAALDQKAKQFEEVFEGEKEKHKDTLDSAEREHAAAVNEYNKFVQELKEKYDALDTEDLNQMSNIDPADIARHQDLGEQLAFAKTRFYGINEGLKAAVFSQVGLLQDAERAAAILRQIESQDTIGINYKDELSAIFDRFTRDSTLARLQRELQVVSDETKPLVQAQVDAFKELKEYLDRNFDEGKTYDEERVAKLIKRYLYTIQRQINVFDNNQSLEQRMDKEGAKQLQALKEYMKLQKQNQENLNLNNYLSAKDNFEEYYREQSFLLAKFFSQAADLAEQDEIAEKTQAATPAPVPTVTPVATPVETTPVVTPTETSPVTTPVVATTPIVAQIPDRKAKKASIRDLMYAIINNKPDEVERLTELVKDYEPELFFEMIDSPLFRTTFTPEQQEAVNTVIRSIIGDDVFYAHVGRPEVQEEPKEEQEVETQTEPEKEPAIEEQPEDTAKQEAEQARQLEEEEKARQLEEAQKRAAAEPPPIEINEGPPTTKVGDFMPGTTLPAGQNYISVLVDTAREDGNFLFEAVNPKEIEMEGQVPKEKDGRIVLKTAGDPKLLRHHYILEKISKEIAGVQDTEPFRYRIKLEILNDENKEWFYQRDDRSNPIIAVVVNEAGEYVYFDNKGNETTKALGTPFGIEYEDVFYTPSKLNVSRNSLGGPVDTGITPNYGNDPAPLLTIVSLLHARIPVYGSILGVTSGTLSAFNNNNTFKTEMKPASSYKMRTVQELIAAGEIEEQDFDVRVDGYYIDYPKDPQGEQRTKIGRPFIYDAKTDLYIPLTGKKLRDITFKGTNIPKDSQLYEIIDILDKKGEISLETLREDGIRIIGSREELMETYNFLREILYSKNFGIALLGDTIRLNRNVESKKANSVWDAEINYVRGRLGHIYVPLSKQVDEATGEPLETTMPYIEFMHENFTTGVAKAIITPSDVRFTKLNKRIIFQLDKNYSQLKDTLANGAPVVKKTKERPQIGDVFSPEVDLTRTYKVVAIEDDNASIVEDGTDKEQQIDVNILLDKWVRLDKAQKSPEPVITEKQQLALKKIANLSTTRTPSKYRVTGIIRPGVEDKTTTINASRVVGSAIDHIAKSVFSGKKLSPSDEVIVQEVKSTIGTYFKSPAHFTEVVKTITRIKNDLVSQGYIFKTGVLVYDKDANISGEIDILLIDPEGVTYVADFKTAQEAFDEKYLGRTYDEVSNKEYFATQGYLYGLILNKQTGLPVASSNKIIGLNIAYTDEKNPTDTKVVAVRDSKEFVFNFPNSSIVPFYKKEGKPITDTAEIVKIYEELKVKTSTGIRDNISAKTGKKRKGDDSLLMTITDVNLIAATRPELEAEIKLMTEMLGGDFVARFANSLNSKRYGEWNQGIVTLYDNAIKGTVYHEGWHQFSQLFLTPQEKIKMYQSLRDQNIPYTDRKGIVRNTGTDDDLSIEEMLADEFVKFVQAPSTYKFPRAEQRGILAFFKRMWRALKEWWSGTKNPDRLFKDLYTGNLRHYSRDINNALWGKLNSAIVNDDNMEIINHSRTGLYIGTTSYFLGQILEESSLSPSWLVENLRNERIKNKLYDKFSDLLDERIDRLSVPTTGNLLNYILQNPEEVIQRTVTEKNISPELAAMYVGQIKEINDITDDTNGGFDNFYDYYLKNSDIDTISSKASSSLDLTEYYDSEEINSFQEEYGDDEFGLQEDEEVSGTIKAEFGQSPNEKSAFSKASKEVQDFFRMLGVVTGIENDQVQFQLNELGVPETYDYATVFNRTKGYLAGKFTIEDMLAKLSNPKIQRDFPAAKLIFDKFQRYLQRDNAENDSFIQKFRNIMGLPEVNNIELTVNLDVAQEKNTDNQKTIIKLESISKISEAEEVRQWEYSFSRINETRPYTTITDDITASKLYNDRSPSNILYNVGGSIILNPFYDYTSLNKEMGDKEFLHTIGIDLHDRFWESADDVKFAKTVKSLFIKNMERYRVYADAILMSEYLPIGSELEDLKASTIPAREDVEQIIKGLFIQNPFQSFRNRRIYKIGNETLETFSLTKALEDISRQNSVYTLRSTAASFVTGDGKTKWASYDPALITYRTQMLNNIANVRDFNDNIEYAGLNPNASPWLKNSLFYERMFDGSGNRRVVSRDLKNNDDSNLSNEKVRIELADLSSFTTIKDGKYNSFHPKALSAQDKLFFDTITLLTDGFIEIPRAATSSTMFAIKLNSYDAIRVGTNFRPQFLPIDLIGMSVSSSPSTGKLYPNFGKKFSAIMEGYLAGELHKLRWYFDNNPDNRLAKELNIFKELLPEDLTKKLISEATTVTYRNQDNLADKIKDIVNENQEEIRSSIRDYFSNYITDLYKGNNNSNLTSGMSSAQKAVLKNVLKLYENRARSQSTEDIKRQQEIAETAAEKEQRSAYQSVTEKAAQQSDAALSLIAGLFAANQFILNVEYHTWYMGDNYLFSNPFKRGNLTTSTGTLAVVSEHTNHILNAKKGETLHSLLTGNNDPKDYRKVKTKVVRDVVTRSRNIDIMINDLVNFEKEYDVFPEESLEERKERLLNLLAPKKESGDRGGYAAINAADGQAKIGLDAYRAFRKIFGTWLPNDEKEYRRQIAIVKQRKKLPTLNKERDEILIKEGPYTTFNPQKWGYSGPELDLDQSGNITNSPMRTKFDKMSLHPLIPEMLIGTGLPDEKLLIEMAMEDIDYTKFESAAKGVKHDTIADFFDEFGNDNPNFRLEDASPEWLLSSYVRRQQPTDDSHKEDTLGSQQRVMVFDVKYLPEVQRNTKELKKILAIEERYLDAIEGITSFEKAQILNEYGLKESGSKQSYQLKIEDYTRFAAAINSIAKKQNFPANVMEYLQYNPSSDTYTYNPSLVFNRKMLLDAIGGEIDRKLRRIKTKGISAVQVTSVGNTRQPYTNPTQEQIKQFGTNGLHFYHYIYDDNGDISHTSTMGVKVTLQGDFENLLNLKFQDKRIANLETLNKAIKDPEFKKKHMDKLTFYGYRIPTNNNNFIDHAEVMEFLPKSAGNIIIAPMEQITKSGSDFDIDRMHLMFPSIDSNGTLVGLPAKKIEDIYEDLNKITTSVPDYKATQKQIVDFIKGGKRQLDKIITLRDKYAVKIKQKLYVINAAEYNARVAAGNSLPQMLDEFFRPFTVDDETLRKDVTSFERLSQLAGEDAPSVDESKIDRDFQSLMRDLNKYKDYHTNQALLSLKDVLSHPAYLKILISPSNSNYLAGLARKIGGITGRVVNDNLPSTRNMLYTIMNAKHKEYLVDSKDIGAYSVQRRWFSLLNYSKMELVRDWQYGSARDKMRIRTPLAALDEREKLGTLENIRLYGNNLDDISPRELWDQMMTLTIDLPSDTVYTLFGINVLNKKTTQYLMASRYGMETVLNFINQPILQEVYATYAKKVKEISNYSLKHALLDVAKAKKINNSDFQDLYTEAYVKDKKTGIIEGANVFVKNPGIAANRLIDEDEYFSTEQMRNDITTEDRNDPAYLERQKKILLYFMTVNLEASNFTGMQFAFSEDRNKNVNYFTIEENNQKKEELRGGEYSDIPVDGSMFSKDAITKLEKRSIYSMFSYGKIAQLFYKEFAKEFTDLKISSSIMRLLRFSNTFGINRQILASRIEGDFIEFIYKNFGKFNINIYDPFEDKISPSTERFGFHFMKSIFNISKEEDFKTYGSKLSKFLERYPELEERIEFVKRLYPHGFMEREKKDDKSGLNEFDTFKANVLRFSRSKENTIQERNFFAKQLENLITFNPAEFKLTKEYSTEDRAKISAFFTELAYLTLYQAGPTNIADNFSDLLPNSLWQQFSTGAFETYKKAVNSGKIGERELLKMFNMMFIENNPTIPWKNKTLIYDLSYFERDDLTKAERDIIYQTGVRKPIRYFRNFTAGKAYDIELLAEELKFQVKDLTC